MIKKLAKTAAPVPKALTPDEKEQRDLYDRIRRSLAKLEHRNLLAFMDEHKSKVLSAKEILIKDLPSDDEGAVRIHMHRLRQALAAYFMKHPGEKWKCNLPKLPRGYKLVYEIAVRSISLSATEAVWMPHARFGEDVLVACGSHLFFHDRSNQSAFRFYDFNEPESQLESTTLEKFRIAHPEASKDGLVPWHHSYLSNGEVNAYECLVRWFHKKSRILPRRYQSHEVTFTSVLGATPILLGRPETNSHMKTLLGSGFGKEIGYSIHSKLGAIAIAKITPHERKKLRRFPLTQTGILGPVPSNEMVFGLMSRFPNPSGHGCVTIISADSHAKAVSTIAEILTSDAHAEEILEQTGWDWRKGLPETFEMLFAITVSGPNMAGVGKAELLISRPSPKSPSRE